MPESACIQRKDSYNPNSSGTIGLFAVPAHETASKTLFSSALMLQALDGNRLFGQGPECCSVSPATSHRIILDGKVHPIEFPKDIQTFRPNPQVDSSRALSRAVTFVTTRYVTRAEKLLLQRGKMPSHFTGQLYPREPTFHLHFTT